MARAFPGRYTMEALHAAAEMKHDETAWEHIWPEDWDTMWSPAERRQGVESIMVALWQLCEVLTHPDHRCTLRD